MKIGQAIRKIRNEKGIKQKFIAEKAGFSSEYLSNIESGTKTPTIPSLSKICDALGISLAYLLLLAVEADIEETVPKEKIEDLKDILKSVKPLTE
jgi:XRE family transcriptional regulator, regulator of sulfur utilization